MTHPSRLHVAPGTEPAWLLRAEGLTKRYGHTTALDQANFDLHAGEAVAIMGPSGSGKSTLLHAMAGIITADEGTVSVRTPPPATCTRSRPSPTPSDRTSDCTTSGSSSSKACSSRSSPPKRTSPCP